MICTATFLELIRGRSAVFVHSIASTAGRITPARGEDSLQHRPRLNDETDSGGTGRADLRLEVIDGCEPGRRTECWFCRRTITQGAGSIPFGAAPLMHPRRGIGLSPPDPVVCKLLIVKE